jgi:hypothetical protein
MSFDYIDNQLIGLSEENATKLCRDRDYHVRVICRDGRYRIVNRGLRPDRMTLWIEKGIVTTATIG